MTKTARLLLRLLEHYRFDYHKQLARLLELPEYQLSRYINSVRIPSYTTACKMQKLLKENGLQVSLEELGLT
jgi:transcriptional regulator with XRE-family HTH domain